MHPTHPMPGRGRASLRLFDVAGRLVTTVHDGMLESGVHELALGTPIETTGVLFYRLRALGETRTGTIVRRP